MAWDKGFNFRGTSGYVTDGANTTYVLLTDAYPTTRNSVTFGWSSGVVAAADRNSGLDARLAGINFTTAGIPAEFQVDLPATGDYVITIAMGDTSSQGSTAVAKLRDGSGGTVLITLSVSIDANQWWDATGVERTSAANWVSGNATQQVTFTGSTLILSLGPTGATTYSTFAHLFVSQVVAAGGKPWYAYAQQRIMTRLGWERSGLLWTPSYS